jgi:hypothetical protein
MQLVKVSVESKEFGEVTLKLFAPNHFAIGGIEQIGM